MSAADEWTDELAIWSIASMLGIDRDPGTVREAVRKLAEERDESRSECISLRGAREVAERERDHWQREAEAANEAARMYADRGRRFAERLAAAEARLKGKMP